MFMLVSVEQLHRLIRRPGQTIRAVDQNSVTSTSDAAVASPGQVDVDVPPGTRYQLFRALRAMSEGAGMVVEHRIPNLSAHFDYPGRREEWFQCLRAKDSWTDLREIDPVMVPGTAYPCVIGRILLRHGWCIPSERPHWVPNLRLFFLSDVGRAAFLVAQAWWFERSPLERLQLMLCE